MPGKIGTPEEWRAARLALLAKEKELTRTADALKAERRALPMVPVTKTYDFQTTDGPATLQDLFGTKSQLIVYHFMFGPEAEEGCHGCATMVANFPDLRHLADKDTALVVVSRAPIEKLAAFKEKNHWSFPWVSSHGSDFNYDFHATLDDKVAPVEYNFRTAEELLAAGQKMNVKGEQPGLSVFKRDGSKVYHTYSAYARGLEGLITAFGYLDLTPAGRQDGPEGPAEFKTPAEYDEETQGSQM